MRRNFQKLVAALLVALMLMPTSVAFARGGGGGGRERAQPQHVPPGPGGSCHEIPPPTWLSTNNVV